MTRRNLTHLLALVLFGLTASMWAQSAGNTTDVQGDRKPGGEDTVSPNRASLPESKAGLTADRRG